MAKEVEIKLFGGKTIGWVIEESNGDKRAVAFGGKTLGRYYKSTNTTKDFYGRIVAYGDVAGGLVLVASGYKL